MIRTLIAAAVVAAALPGQICFTAHADPDPNIPECVYAGWCGPWEQGVKPGYYNENGQPCPNPLRSCMLDDLRRGAADGEG